MKKTLFILTVLMLTSVCNGRTIVVDANGSGDFETIQAAIDDSNDGDIVEVQPGVYTEEIVFGGKAITVTSAAGAAIIQALDEWGDAVLFLEDEEANSVLKNFVIRNSYAGVFARRGSPTITNITFVNNKYGVEASTGYDPDISNCIFWNNTEADMLGCGASYSCYDRAYSPAANIREEPLFVDPNNDDYHLRSQGWYWDNSRQRWDYDDVTSRCIDAGNPHSSLENEPLTIPGDPDNAWGQNLRINMGAFGGTVEASMGPHDWALLGDLTNNGIVDHEDLYLQLEYWLSPSDQRRTRRRRAISTAESSDVPPSEEVVDNPPEEPGEEIPDQPSSISRLNSTAEMPGDISRDGIVDMTDYALLANSWLKQTLWYEDDSDSCTLPENPTMEDFMWYMQNCI